MVITLQKAQVKSNNCLIIVEIFIVLQYRKLILFLKCHKIKCIWLTLNAFDACVSNSVQVDLSVEFLLLSVWPNFFSAWKRDKQPWWKGEESNSGSACRGSYRTVEQLPLSVTGNHYQQGHTGLHLCNKNTTWFYQQTQKYTHIHDSLEPYHPHSTWCEQAIQHAVIQRSCRHRELHHEGFTLHVSACGIYRIVGKFWIVPFYS